jgi:phosphate-selective porin OprO/OprP
VGLGVLLFAAPLTGWAQEPDVKEMADAMNRMRRTIRALRDRVEELEAGQAQQKVQGETFLKMAKELAESGPRGDWDFRVYWNNGLRMDSGNGLVKLKIGGRAMIDAFWVDDSGIDACVGDLQDGVEVRRARLYWQGTLFKKLEFKWQFDWAEGQASVKDAYLKFKKVPWLQNVTIGHFKEPMGLEELTSSKYITFLERSMPIEAFAPSRNFGIMASGTLLDERMTYAAGVFRDLTGAAPRWYSDGGYNLTARVTWLPWYEENGRRLLHLGASYSFRAKSNTTSRFRARPEFHSAGRFVDSGAFLADDEHLFGAEMALVYGPLSVQAELLGASADVADNAIDNACFCGWYVQASYFLTGEHRPYKTSSGAFDRVKPKKSYCTKGGWGAWEIAARYSHLDVDDEISGGSGGEEHNVTIGLNWYLNPNVRLMWNYIRACVDRRNCSEAADIFAMRMQFDF